LTEVVVEQSERLLIFARDPDRARTFYARVLGWSLPGDGRRSWVITSDDDHRSGIDGPGPTGADTAREPSIPTIHVANVAAAAAAAVAAGGAVLVPRIPLPGVGWLIHLADTEGNVIGIMQDDSRAAWPQRTPDE
jgi:uncharacterized protein